MSDEKYIKVLFWTWAVGATVAFVVYLVAPIFTSSGHKIDEIAGMAGVTGEVISFIIATIKEAIRS